MTNTSPGNYKTRITAFLVHFAFSAVIVGIFIAIVTGLWFPGELAALENVWQGLGILIAVALVSGPILTLLVYIPGKKGMMFDLVVIALVQSAALLYGGFLIYEQRPAVFVFAGDRFEIITAGNFDASNLPAGHYRSDNIDYPLITYALPAQTHEEKSRFIINNVQYQTFPERYRPIDDYKDVITQKGLDIDRFRPDNASSDAAVNAFRRQHAHDKNIVLLPLEGTTGNSIVIALDLERASVTSLMAIDPWREYNEAR